jgi:hypothetical protein
MMTSVFHYTDKDGYNGVRAPHPDWIFKVSQPVRKDHPVGAYFTIFPPDTKLLSNKIRVPRSKMTHFFEFSSADDLQHLGHPKKRGEFVLYSSTDYTVAVGRQKRNGEASEGEVH